MAPCRITALGDRDPHRHGGRCLPLARSATDGPRCRRQRQQLVSTLVDQRNLRLALQRLLRPMGDLERLADGPAPATPAPEIWWPLPTA